MPRKATGGRSRWDAAPDGPSITKVATPAEPSIAKAAAKFARGAPSRLVIDLLDDAVLVELKITAAQERKPMRVFVLEALAAKGIASAAAEVERTKQHKNQG
jgi:hypothetical protein